MQLQWNRTVFCVHRGHGLLAIALLAAACSSTIESPEGDPNALGSALGGSAGQAAPASCTPVDTADTVCDGIDEDCDGNVDEDCDFDPADCPPGYEIIEGTRGNDTLIGTLSRDCIVGFGGDDVIYGLHGDDLLVGGPGDDVIYGGTGEDTILGGAGHDVIHGGSGDDTIEGGDGNDRIDAGLGNDDVSGGLCHDLIRGGFGFDDLRGDDGSDRIYSFRTFNRVDGGNGFDACSDANCEISPLVPMCEQDSDCAAGERCVVNSGVCVSPDDVPFTDETCDGIDDDCSGEVDEDYAPVMTSCGVGACAAIGATVCNDGVEENDCTPGTPAANDASCNGVDDDCDNASDEDYVGAAVECGTGACSAVGMTICLGGMEHTSCVPGTPAANDATCDTVDDDCDGTSDEDFAGAVTHCGLGACAATGVTSCVAGGVQDSCTPGAPAANDATCDGVDDDCDGAIDEDFQPSCSGSASHTCVGGQIQIVECDDADSCNGAESCSAGACMPGVPVVVDDGDPCTSDSCDPQTGAVTHDPVPVGTSCSDGNVCNGEETCQLESSCAAVPSGAVALWRAEGDASDDVGNNDGTMLNGAGFAAGHVGQAFSLNGVDDRTGNSHAVSFNAHAPALNLAGQATFELWLRTASDTCRTVFHLMQDSTNEQFLRVGNGCAGVPANSLVSWRRENGSAVSSVGYVTANRAALVDGGWHHLAVTFDGTQTHIYIDGAAQPVTIGAGSDHGDWGGFANPVSVTLGATFVFGGYFGVFEGQMDEAALYNRALTPAEIASIYMAGTEGKCGGGGGGGGGDGLSCTPGAHAPSGTSCEDGGQCDGAGMCLP